MDDGAPTAEDMQHAKCLAFFDSSRRSSLWNTTVRKIAERTASSGAEGGLDSLFHSFVRERFFTCSL